MEFYILDTELNIISIIDTFKSAIWTTRYFKSGDFELYIAATEKMLNTLKKDYYVVKTDDTEKCMIIENIQLSTDIEEGNYLIVTGRSLSSVLNRRILIGTPTGINQYYPVTVSGTVEECIRQLVEKNTISPNGGGARKIPFMELGEKINITTEMEAQYTGTNLEETIQEICKTYGIGYDVKLDLTNKKFLFTLLQGTDRSYNQTNNSYVIFSNEFENLLTSKYTFNNQNIKNCAYIAGEGEGMARKWYKISLENSKFMNRRELFVDARDLSTNDGKISDNEYLNLLAQRGIEKISEYKVTESIEGEAEPNGNFIFEKDYFLGDIVEVINEYGLEMTPRITEVIESEDDTGHYIIPTFCNE